MSCSCGVVDAELEDVLAELDSALHDLEIEETKNDKLRRVLQDALDRAPAGTSIRAILEQAKEL